MRYHGAALRSKDGADLQPAPKETYSGAIIDELERLIEAGTPIAAINAAIPGAFDSSASKEVPDRYFDGNC